MKDFEELRQKIEAMKAAGEVDLSLEEDLSLAVMNLIAIEEHLFFTAQKTGKPTYLDLLREVREMRKEHLGKLIDKSKFEGETWCTSKHLLSATMRLMEVGTKLLGDGKKEEAQKFFEKSYRLYTLFWGLRLKLLNMGDLKEEAEKEDKQAWSLNDIVDKLVDCCDE